MRGKANQTRNHYFSDPKAGEFSQVQETEMGGGSMGVRSSLGQAEPPADPQGESLDPLQTLGQV